MYQKDRKDLAHARALTTISTRHTASSRSSRKSTLRASHSDKGSSTFLFWGLTFESERQISAKTDALTVQAVPSNFVGVSKPSEAVEKLMTKRKVSYEDALEAMRKELAAVHDDCENEIRERCNQTKTQIDNIHATVEEARQRIQEIDILRLTDKDLRSAWDSIKQLVTEEERLINELHECLRDVERSRRPRVKEVMHKYHEIFHSISYTSSFEVQSLLENEIHDYNKTVLMNFKIYENLHLQMCIRIGNWNKELEDWLEDMKKRRRDALASEHFEQLIRRKNSLGQVEEFFIYDPAGQFARKELTTKLHNIEEVIGNWASTIIIFDETSVNDCTDQLIEAVSEINISGAKLVVSYKSALQSRFDQYEKEVESFKVANKTGFWEEDMERLDRAVQSLRDVYQSNTTELEDSWNRHLSCVENSVEGICSFLRGFNSVWKNQAKRLVELQESTGRSVDDLTAKSQKSIEELEKKIITYTQQLREATNEDKMKQQLTAIYSTLDLIREKYQFVYDEECKAAEKYVESVFDAVPRIIEQFNEFIESYDQSATGNSEEEIATYLPDGGPEFIRQQLQMSRNLGPGILYWKTILLKNIAAFRDTFSEATREAAQEWQKSIFTERSSVLQAKLEANLQRREDIRISIYDVRVQEIESHSKKLQDHIEEVNQILKDTSDRLDEFLREQKQSLQNYETDINQANEQIPSGKSTTAVHRLQKKIEKIREDYKTEVEKKSNDCREELESTLKSLLDKNDDFINEIRLFKEGGNFSVEEAKSYRQTLTLWSKTISKSKTANAQKMLKAFGELSKAIEKSYKPTVDRINVTTRELKFYEDAQKILTKCAVILERQVLRFLEDNTRFVNAVADTIEKSTEECCKISDVDIFADMIIQLLSEMDLRLDNLTIGFPVAKPNSANEQVKPNRKTSNGKQRKRQASVQKALNYRQLFAGSDEKSSCKNCFSTAAMSTMLKTIDEIQMEAMTFFATTAKRRDSEAKYRDYMQQILHQLHCYLQQLEDLWRQEVQEILTATEAFERSILDCISNSLNDIHESHMTEIITTKEMALRALKKTIKVHSSRRDKMFDSLKVSHGHPENKDSLIKLTEDVMGKVDEMQEVIINEFEEYKTQLRGIVRSCETSLQNEAEPLIKVLTKLKDRGKRLRLKELVEERNRVGSPELTGISYKLDLPNKTNRRSFEDLHSAPYSSFDIESVVTQLIEKARDLCNSTVEEWESDVNSFLEANEEFKQTWERNVEIVTEVYESIL